MLSLSALEAIWEVSERRRVVRSRFVWVWVRRLVERVDRRVCRVVRALWRWVRVERWVVWRWVRERRALWVNKFSIE